MWVVKIGGSLLRSGELAPWCRVLAREGAGKLVIVPGGGVFAATVREVQDELGVSGFYAHRMALKAMEQYGLLMMGLDRALVFSADEEDLRRHVEAGRVPIWFPHDMVSQCAEITASWDVTSDSLGAWLAARLGAQHLALIKCAEPAGRSISVGEACLGGVVDAAFARFMKPAIATWWLHASEHAGFGSVLRGESVPRTRVVVG